MLPRTMGENNCIDDDRTEAGQWDDGDGFADPWAEETGGDGPGSEKIPMF